MTAPVAIVADSGIEVRRWTTAGALWRALWALWALDLIVLAALLHSGRVHSDGLKTVGKDAAPSVILAQKIKLSLADMDANAAKELLAEPGSQSSAVQAYTERRQQAAEALVRAAEKITYGAAERQPIVQIEVALGRYESLIQQARDLRNEGKPSFLFSYQNAVTLMDRTILPAADELDKVNLDELNAAYSSERSKSLTARLLVAGAVLAMLAFLAGVQSYLFRRTNRVFNLPLLAATLLLVAFVGYTWNRLDAASHDLKGVREDAFTSINALWKAWSLAYSANADQRRFLLDVTSGEQSTQAFRQKRDAIATLPAGETWQSVADSPDPKAATGYLADELNNITFKGELEAAQETLRTWSRYIMVDDEMRRLQASGKTNEAIALCLGASPGQSDYAFGQFSTAIGQTLQINQQAFDASLKAGFSRLEYFDLHAGIVSAIVAILCLLGLMQRIREYN